MKNSPLREIATKFEFWCVLICGAAIWLLMAEPEARVPSMAGTLRVPEQKTVYFGDFKAKFDDSKQQFQLFSVRTGQVVLENPPGQNFLAVGMANAEITESHGHFQWTDHYESLAIRQVIDTVNVTWPANDKSANSGAILTIQGHFEDEKELKYVLNFIFESSDTITASVEVRKSGKLAFKEAKTRHILRFKTRRGESFFGLGAQCTHLRLNGQKIQSIVSEQGIGRGLEPISTAVNSIAGAAGTSTMAYAPVPFFLSSKGFGLDLRSSDPAIFDFSNPNYYSIQCLRAVNKKTALNLYVSTSAKQILKRRGEIIGTMPEPPAWLDNGIIVGLQGGTKKLEAVSKQLSDAGVPISAFWLQDWIGQRKTAIGWQLWWNWDVDKNHYPNWTETVKQLNSKGIKTLAYLNPFLVKVDDKSRRQLYQEAESQHYLVRDANGKIIEVPITSFSAALVDLSNPKARDWLKAVIKKELVETGVRGWMADFGEALPVHAKMHNGQSGLQYHNQYTVEWARLNREILEETGLLGKAICFHRSGYSNSSRFATMFWLGDQMVSWDKYDGMHSAVVGLLSSGISGMTLNHSDSGGYTTVDFADSFVRTPELLKRWLEFSAFTAVLRSHEGNKPAQNAQIYSSPELAQHTAFCAKLYKALGTYRRGLFADAANLGLPVVRPMFLRDLNDPRWHNCDDQFTLGDDLVVAPILHPGQTRRSVVLPTGNWRHLWTGDVYSAGAVVIEAPIGKPAAFVRIDSVNYQDVVEGLREQQLIDWKIEPVENK